MRSWQRILLAGVLMLTAWQCAARDLVIGSIEENPSGEIAKLKPLADYLANRLRGHGITGVKVVVVTSMAEMVTLFRQQRVDLMMDSPYPALAVSHLGGADVRLRRWKKGKKEYHGILVARSDAGIEQIGQLRGKMVAFEEAHSTSAFFLPLLALEDAGLVVQPKGGLGAAVAPNEIGYVFSYDEENTVAMLMRGRVQAAALGSHDFEALRTGEKAQFKVLLQTRAAPRQLMILRHGLDAQLAGRICELLKGMEADPEAAAALTAYDRTTRFDDIPADQQKVLDAMRATIKRIHQGGK